jgi:hypothetical protein
MTVCDGAHLHGPETPYRVRVRRQFVSVPDARVKPEPRRLVQEDP